MSLTAVFNTDYWFSAPGVITTQALWILLVFFVGMIVIGIVFKQVAQKGKVEKFLGKVLQKWGSLLMLMGFFGLLYVWLRYERTPLFSFRFMLGIWVLGFIFWAYKILKYQKKKVPELRERHQRDAERYAYVPRPR